MSICFEEEVVGQAFRTAAEDVLGKNHGSVIKAIFVALGTAFVGTILTALVFGSESALFAFGIGAGAAAAVVLYHSFTFRDKFKERVRIEIRHGSHVIYDELNQKFYNLINKVI